MKHEEVVETLEKSAKKRGANSVKLISTKDVVVDEYVRQKCKYGCDSFAKHFTCPPYAPSPSETREVMESYDKALLVEFTGLKKKPDQVDVHNVMFEMEREAFLNGFYRAFAYSAGPCRLCKRCPAEEIENASDYDKKYCRNPLKARPSMEACGIDVYRTVRKAGLEINVVREGDTFRSFGLLLLE